MCTFSTDGLQNLQSDSAARRDTFSNTNHIALCSLSLLRSFVRTLRCEFFWYGFRVPICIRMLYALEGSKVRLGYLMVLPRSAQIVHGKSFDASTTMSCFLYRWSYSLLFFLNLANQYLSGVRMILFGTFPTCFFVIGDYVQHLFVKIFPLQRWSIAPAD